MLAALRALYPNSQWSLVGDSYDGLQWLDEDTQKPSEAELLAYTPRPTQQDYADALQSHIDLTARSRGYADGAALATYATSTIPQWATEAQAFIAWRDAAWIYAYTALGLVQGGAEPPSIDEFVSAAPAIVWP